MAGKATAKAEFPASLFYRMAMRRESLKAVEGGVNAPLVPVAPVVVADTLRFDHACPG